MVDIFFKLYIYIYVKLDHYKKIFKNINYYFSYKNHFQLHYQTPRKNDGYLWCYSKPINSLMNNNKKEIFYFFPSPFLSIPSSSSLK
jgi:hypothetical protein